MLMIGSAGSNIGKTELACRIIRKFSCCAEITGIKVTTILKKDGRCPRGGIGCGVCSSLEGNYCITEEKDVLHGKDTAKMLNAGAKRVFWLRVLKDHLDEGLTALLNCIGDKAVSVCESNSLRLVAEPGLFFVVRKKGSHAIKTSCENVIGFADRVVLSGKSDFDIDLNHIRLVDGKWFMQLSSTAIILAGGKSGRMGQDKSMLNVMGKPMIEHIFEQIHPFFDQVLISSNDMRKYAFINAEAIPDKIPGQGPLMGILSSLEASSHNLNFVVACDVPTINLGFIMKMMRSSEGYDCVIPVRGKSKFEPLYGIYRKSMIAPIQETLNTKRRKIIDAFSNCKIKYIDITDAEWYENLNTMEEYYKYKAANEHFAF